MTDDDTRALLRAAAAAMPPHRQPVPGTARAAAAALAVRLTAHPGFRASRPLNMAVACLNAAHRLDDPDPQADLPATSAPGLRAFRRANALSGSEWHHGRFRMNRRAIPRLERLLRLWAPTGTTRQGTVVHRPAPPRLCQSV